MKRHPTPQNGVQQLSPERAKALFERQVKRSQGMSAQEFTRRWKTGKITHPTPEQIRLSMLIPLGR